MARLAQTIGTLERFADPAIDEAAAAALPTAGPQAAPLLAEMLLRRGGEAGLIGLVVCFHVLGAEWQARVLERIDDLFGALREAASRRDTTGPGNTIEIIRRTRAARLAYLLSDPLQHGSADLKQDAADCLLELAIWCCSDRPSGSERACDGRTAMFVQAVVERAIQSYDRHRQPVTLLALGALAPRAMGATWQRLSQPRRMAGEALRALLKDARDPGLCRAMPGMLAESGLAASALAGLARAVEGPRLAAVLAGAHVARHGPASAALRSAEQVAAAMPATEDLIAAAAHLAVALPAWMAAVPLLPSIEIGHLVGLSRHGDRMARLAALRRLTTLARPGDGGSSSGTAADANAAISRFCLDPESLLARIALRHLVRVGWPDLPRLLPRLVNSNDQPLRDLAARYLARVGFERLWVAWPRLDRVRRLAAGSALIKVDREFHCQLARRLSRQDRDVCVRALSIVCELNQGPPFEAALLALAGSTDSVVASAAARALGTVDSEAVVAALQRLLLHEDERVRANAIEALEQLKALRDVGQVSRIAERDANRPRANAIHAMLDMRFAEGLAALSDMLKDERPDHRASALWLVRSAGLLELTTKVAEMAVSDPHETIRGRADQVVRSLIELMRKSPETDGATGSVGA